MHQVFACSFLILSSIEKSHLQTNSMNFCGDEMHRNVSKIAISVLEGATFIVVKGIKLCI